MCWSWQVSLVFTLFELSCVTWLMHRNKFLDRTLGLLALVIACQELCQFLIWGFGIDNNTSEYECSIFNIVVSVFIFLIPESVPFCYLTCLYFATYNPDKISNNNSNINNNNNNNSNDNDSSFLNSQSKSNDDSGVNVYDQVFKALVALSFVHLSIAIIYYGVYYGAFSDHAPCTYISDSGHQVWQFGDSDLHALNWFVDICYVFFLTICGLIFRPGWVMIPPIANSIFCYIILKTTIKNYTSSRWCWEAGFNCIWYLVTPYVAQWIVNYFEKHDMYINDDYDDLNLHWSMKWIFIGTKQLFDGDNFDYDYKEIKDNDEQVHV